MSKHLELSLKHSLAILFLAVFAASCAQQKSVASGSSEPSRSEIVEPAKTFNSPTEEEVATAQKLVEKAPDVASSYARLATAYIRLARETGDFSVNSKAEAAVNRALEIEPENLAALKLKSSLLLTFHRFAEARDFAARLQKQHPNDAFFYGVLTDANIELGDYEAALAVGQKMVDLRPNMESFARVSQIRSLYGDTEGAIEAILQAAKIADPQDKEPRAWCLWRLGEENFKAGKFAAAEKAYDAALVILPNYHYALAGKARARAAQGDFARAAELLSDSLKRNPNVETAISLGDIYTRLGKPEEARKQYELAEFIEQKFGNTDLRRLALLWADQDKRLDEAVGIARRERVARRDVYTADTLAWTLYKKGDFTGAKQAISDAMRIKNKDARIFYHAGMIEKALGNRKIAAEYLKKALATNPAFDFLQAEIAEKALKELS